MPHRESTPWRRPRAGRNRQGVARASLETASIVSSWRRSGASRGARDRPLQPRAHLDRRLPRRHRYGRGSARGGEESARRSLLVATRAVARGAPTPWSRRATPVRACSPVPATSAAEGHPSRRAGERLPAAHRIHGSGSARPRARRRRDHRARRRSSCSSPSWAARTPGASPRWPTRASRCSIWAWKRRRAARRSSRRTAAPADAGAQLRRQRRGQRPRARRTDVSCCEGLLGNVVLKLVEGIAERVHRRRSAAARRRLTWRNRLALLSRHRASASSRTTRSMGGADPRLENPFIKCHGRSNARAVANAVKVAAKAVRDRVPAEIAEAVAFLR